MTDLQTTADPPDLDTAKAEHGRATAAMAESTALAADLRDRASKGETVDPRPLHGCRRRRRA